MTVESTGFKASDVLAGNLQKVLTDVTALSLVGKQLHWNITGEGFRSLHLFLDDVVDIAREASDEIAERMRALQVVPNGLPEVVAQRNTLPTVPETIIKTTDAEELAVAAINATVGTMRDVHEKVDAETPPPPTSSTTTSVASSSRRGSSVRRTARPEPDSSARRTRVA